MATENIKTQCHTCKDTRTFNCAGCSKNFCRVCLPKHLQELDTFLEQIETDHDEFREKLIDQKKNPNEPSIIKEIDQWEKVSINKIKQTAEECREKVINHTNNKYLIDIEEQLNDIATKLKQIRQKSQFNETDLNRLKQNLNELNEELKKPSNIKLQQDPSPLIHKISIVTGKFIIKI
jgi:Mg2+ and Co2+ transporter CorA